MWVTIAAGLFFALVLLVTLFRAEKSVANGALAVITLLAITVAIAATVRATGDDKPAVAGLPQAGAVLPALACLDGLAGENVEAACEKAVFASAESTAAAVSYTATQVSRLAAHGDVATADKSMTPEFAILRRAVERDRFGLAAHVLATREQCTPANCGVFRSLSDRKQIAANMAEKTYDGFVGRYALVWSASQSVAAAAPAAQGIAGGQPVASVGKPTNADFPSAASIPPVSIMGAEPSGPAPGAAAASRQAAAPPAAAPPPAAASPFPPVAIQPAPRAAAASASSAPPPAPAKKQQASKQRTSAPVQLAPPAEADDN